MRLILRREIKSGNAFAYSHWSKRTKDRNVWAAHINGALMMNRIPKATGKRAVVVTSYRSRDLDEDNLSAGFKHGRDCLVRAGLLVDDTKKWCSFTYVQLRPKNSPTGKPCTVIDFTEIENEP